jgi:hypothetical protein
MVYAQRIPEMAHLQLNERILEELMDTNPRFRQGALLHHRRFQEQIHETERKMQAGELLCAHILQSGKECPNHNEPGSPYCGLHKEQHADGESSGEDA